VTAIDWSPPALLATAANAERNGVSVETLRCSWSEPEPLVERGPWDLVIASDVLYERGQMDAILGLLDALDRPETLITDPGRATAEDLPERVAGRWELRTQRSARLPRVRVHRLRRPGR
jgi:predicted nicotinamide N-methyase